MGRFCIAVCLPLLVAGVALSGEMGHYPTGAEGIKAASLPPPGFYLKNYVVDYRSNRLKDDDHQTQHVDFKFVRLAPVPRFVWMTKKKFLGADYGMDLAIPVIYDDVHIDALGVDDAHTNIGDILVEPLLLGWHGPRYDIGAGAGIWVPTGDWDADEPAESGKDFWSGMFTLGATYYLDKERTWSASALARYEIHTKKHRSRVRPGDDLSIEWGIGKDLPKGFTLGVAGYFEWQITDDAGGDVTWNKNYHDRVFAVGPEVCYAFFRKIGSAGSERKKFGYLSLRYLREFDAHDRPEGHFTALTFVWQF